MHYVVMVGFLFEQLPNLQPRFGHIQQLSATRDILGFKGKANTVIRELAGRVHPPAYAASN
jgi:hypothetical protein